MRTWWKNFECLKQMTKIALHFKLCKCMVSHSSKGAKVLGKQGAVLGRQTMYSSGLTL